MTRVADFAKDHHDVHLLQGAQELFPALIEAMDAALSDIQFETYIFDFTGAGAQVAEALIRAAQRGVRTHLVVDGVGTGPPAKGWAAHEVGRGAGTGVFTAGAAGAAAAPPLAAPAPQAVRGRWAGAVLWRHQCAGRSLRPQPRRAGCAAL
jgi:hypothetical protein